ncbi:hypothetical protein [Streptococcus sp. DD10]|uniref:hypothetical protein n=1 Tax=Streptococcus sp. DD10 TaxID=1777878 RepID=UPI001E4B5436|nr:hypothetical protein [Streptococcus sp. DD10]
MRAIGNLTLYEYDLLMTGVLLRKEDENEAIHRQAWLNRMVESMRSDGKNPLYKNYKDFYKQESRKQSKRKISDEEMKLLLKANL